MPQPSGISSPVRDDKAHTISDVRGHVVKIAAISSHRLFSSILGHSGSESGEKAISLPEIDLGVELLVCVDSVLISWAISVPTELVVDVLLALATSVTAMVEALGCRGITLVRGGSPGPLVGLHEVELRAPVSGHLIGVAVTPAVCVHPKVTSIVLAWHGNQVEGSNAATLVIGKIDIPLDGATKQVGLEVGWVALVESCCRRDIATAIGRGHIIGTTLGGEAGSHVVGIFLSVNFNLDGGE